MLVPSYTAAYIADKMVYVVPTHAAAGMFVATIETRDVNRMLDDLQAENTEHGDFENEDIDG